MRWWLFYGVAVPALVLHKTNYLWGIEAAEIIFQAIMQILGNCFNNKNAD